MLRIDLDDIPRRVRWIDNPREMLFPQRERPALFAETVVSVIMSGMHIPYRMRENR